MARILVAELGWRLLYGKTRHRDCFGRTISLPLAAARIVSQESDYGAPVRHYSTWNDSDGPIAPLETVKPIRKLSNEQARAQNESDRSSNRQKKIKSDKQVVPGWELTVGIEMHAQLNTSRKLFSPALVPEQDANTTPNNSPRNVAPFDAALPGSLPVFQKETLLPAIRAALALGCEVQRESRWVRKHYFHWDLPSGYQITQLYAPLARDGRVVLRRRDGIFDGHEGDEVAVSIKQVQMEQDTAKTVCINSDGRWGGGLVQGVDLNRAGVPLVEIISEPEIHHPTTAAAYVRKVQQLLCAADACVSGMEDGGLRADINVSVRRSDAPPGTSLGVRTEIKNLSSIRAVEDAVIAERDRQIAVLEAGGVVVAETRGWTIGSTGTRRLRGKEAEVDYRYMPEPDLGPVYVGDDLIALMKEQMGPSPDEEMDALVSEFGLSVRDAMALQQMDGGNRIEFFYAVVKNMDAARKKEAEAEQSGVMAKHKPVSTPSAFAPLVANWLLHELGKLDGDPAFGPNGHSPRLDANRVAELLDLLSRRRIATKVARELLWAMWRWQDRPPSDFPALATYVEQNHLLFDELSAEEYAAVADAVVEGEPKVLDVFLQHRRGLVRDYPQGKLMFLVGKMMRQGPVERMDPAVAERAMRDRIAHKSPRAPRVVKA